jgi:hypothetical protein
MAPLKFFPSHAYTDSPHWRKMSYLRKEEAEVQRLSEILGPVQLNPEGLFEAHVARNRAFTFQYINS